MVARFDRDQNGIIDAEEREEYEPHIKAGNILFAGVDYEATLRRAEQDADTFILQAAA